MSDNDSQQTGQQAPAQGMSEAGSAAESQASPAAYASPSYGAPRPDGCASQGGSVPPAGAAPIPPQSGQPIPPQAGGYPGFVPEPQLSGGLKFGYFLLGFLGNLFGIVVAWLINADKHPAIKGSAVKWSIVGFACTFVVGILIALAFAGFIGAVVAAAAGGGHYAYGTMCF